MSDCEHSVGMHPTGFLYGTVGVEFEGKDEQSVYPARMCHCGLVQTYSAGDDKWYPPSVFDWAGKVEGFSFQFNKELDLEDVVEDE